MPISDSLVGSAPNLYITLTYRWRKCLFDVFAEAIMEAADNPNSHSFSTFIIDEPNLPFIPQDILTQFCTSLLYDFQYDAIFQLNKIDANTYNFKLELIVAQTSAKIPLKTLGNMFLDMTNCVGCEDITCIGHIINIPYSDFPLHFTYETILKIISKPFRDFFAKLDLDDEFPLFADWEDHLQIVILH